MLKKELRKIYLQKRALISVEKSKILSDKIFRNVMAHFSFQKGNNVHIFNSIDAQKEVDTQIFIDYFFEKGIHVYVPKIFGNELKSIQITSETKYVVNSWGISEPADLPSEEEIHFDFAIVPLLYCDHFGNRIGYGKGFYDRLFSTINKDVKKIGVNFFLPHETIDDVSDFDIPLDYLVTPTEVLSFTGEYGSLKFRK